MPPVVANGEGLHPLQKRLPSPIEYRSQLGNYCPVFTVTDQGTMQYVGDRTADVDLAPFQEQREGTQVTTSVLRTSVQSRN